MWASSRRGVSPAIAASVRAAGLQRYPGGIFVLWCLQVVVNQILLGLIAAAGCLLGGTLLLPSLATDELREVLADIIQQCGYSISGYASCVFPPEQVSLSLSCSSFGVLVCFFSAALSMCIH